MIPARDNYLIQCNQAKQLFLTYDQQELIRRCELEHDETYFYVPMFHRTYRIHRQTGDMQSQWQQQWTDGNSFAEVMTLLDWLCDSRPDRYVTGRWINLVSHGYAFHRSLQEDGPDPTAELFDREPEAFCAACRALGGEEVAGADISFAIPFLDGLRILVQLWRGDEEFAPRLRCLWDENALRYLRYETTWYAQGLLMHRLREAMGLQH